MCLEVWAECAQATTGWINLKSIPPPPMYRCSVHMTSVNPPVHTGHYWVIKAENIYVSLYLKSAYKKGSCHPQHCTTCELIWFTQRLTKIKLALKVAHLNPESCHLVSGRRSLTPTKTVSTTHNSTVIMNDKLYLPIVWKHFMLSFSVCVPDTKRAVLSHLIAFLSFLR